MTLIREPVLGGGGGAVTLLNKQVQSSGTQFTYSVPGGSLAADGDMLRITVTGLNWSTLGNFQVRYGGSLIFNTQLDNTSINFGARINIVRFGATAQRCITTAGDGAGGAWKPVNAALTKDNSAAQTIQVDILGSGSTGNLYTMTVELLN